MHNIIIFIRLDWNLRKRVIFDRLDAIKRMIELRALAGKYKIKKKKKQELVFPSKAICV